MAKNTKLIALAVLFAVIPNSLTAEVPNMIIGTWRFDFVKTVTEHVKKKIELSPTTIDNNSKQEMLKSITDSSGNSEPHMFIIFTEDKVIVERLGIEISTSSYVTISENRNQVIIVATDDNGIQTHMTLILVDDGLIIDASDCESYPEECAQKSRIIGRGPIDGHSETNGESDFTLPDEVVKSWETSPSRSELNNNSIQRTYYQRVYSQP